MWQPHLIYLATLRMYVLDGSIACFVSGYFLIASYPTFFPYEGLLKHCIYFITSSSALPFQPPQAVSFAVKKFILGLEMKNNFWELVLLIVFMLKVSRKKGSLYIWKDSS